MALKRNLAVTFEVIKERGPPHMRTFLTCCKVGDIVTEGEGNSKKVIRRCIHLEVGTH
jgi:double-stranded RNA-binding protein Staufen